MYFFHLSELIFGYLFGFTEQEEFYVKNSKDRVISHERKRRLKHELDSNVPLIKFLKPKYISTPLYKITLQKGYIGFLRDRKVSKSKNEVIVEFVPEVNFFRFPYPILISLNSDAEEIEWKSI